MTMTPTSQNVSANGADGGPPARAFAFERAFEEAPPGVPAHRSNYVEYLPGIYHDSDFLGRFLLIFEHILSPIDRTIENIPDYFDPELAPPEVVSWLGSWLGLVLDARWPDERRRDVVKAAPELFRWRGTSRGLSHFLRLYTGIEPEITEPALRDVANDRSRAYRFTVRIRVGRNSPLSRQLVETIIETEKPAFAACSLEWIER
jgi:phage tail-like protein